MSLATSDRRVAPRRDEVRSMLAAGEQLSGRYTIVSVLGEGGYARVYLAHDEQTKTQVAVKQLGLQRPPTEDEKKQFRIEGQLLSKLSHPNLVKVHDMVEEDDLLYLVMDYLEGHTLAEQVRDHGLPPVAQVVAWADLLCDALDYLHTQNPPVVMRDLKPGNLMLGPSGSLHIIDFGIARMLDGQGTILKGAGTPGYAALELQGTGSSDTRADIYSLGATLYALLTGQAPPRALDRAFDDTMQSPRGINGQVPDHLNTCILKMLELRKDRRYQTIPEARSELRSMAATTTVASLYRAPAAAVGRRGPPVAVWVAIGVAVVALLAFLLSRG